MRPSGNRYAVTRDTTTFFRDTSCLRTDPRAQRDGWCVQFPGPFVATVGTTQTYSYRVCRNTTTSGALSFSGAREAIFSVESDHPEWSSAEYDSAKGKAHSIAVKGGTCARWSVRWDTRDRFGDLLPAADNYRLIVMVQAKLSGATPGDNQVLKLKPKAS